MLSLLSQFLILIDAVSHPDCRAIVVGITWPVPADLDDAALERKLFTPPFVATETLRPQPEWALIHAELRRPSVTLLLVWEEYRAGRPEGYGYSRFCDLYAAWRGRLSPTMRQVHPAGKGCSSTTPARR